MQENAMTRGRASSGGRYIRSTGGFDVGTTVQTVWFFVFDLGITHYSYLLSEIRGPWDAATPRGFEEGSEAM